MDNVDNVVYFELNNWFCGRDYPDAQPFIDWLNNDLNQRFRDEAWVKANELVVVFDVIDMSQNYCITAKRSWVEANCPTLLTAHREFLRFAEGDEEVPEGRCGARFLPYTAANIGLHEGVVNYWGDDDDE